MFKPDIRVNSFFKKQSYYLDPISKFYIITEMTLGLNHLELFQNIKSILVRIGYVYCVVSSVTFYYLTFDSNLWLTFPIVTTIDIVSYFLTITISSLLWKRLRSYYMELSSFDAEVGCEIKLSRRSICNFMICMFSLLCFIPIFVLQNMAPSFLHLPSVVLMHMKLLHTVEFFFNAHLLIPLVTRMQLINYLMEDSFPYEESIRYLDKAVKMKVPQKHVDINRLIQYFNKIIKIYDTLNNAIKWQLLSMFIELFLIVLRDMYFFIVNLLERKLTLSDLFTIINISTLQLIPMLSVCVTADTLYKEVVCLQEMLACRLYEGRLEKRDRRPAQALLTLTEARNLSFSLFHMFNIDMSLPFKMFSLLITNLVILLQFEKVKNSSLAQTLLD